jgi:acetyl esterase/lipase
VIELKASNNMMKITRAAGLTIVILFIISGSILAQQVIPLYEGAIPNSIKGPNKEIETSWHAAIKVSQPTLTVFAPPASLANGTAVIICPGGGYMALSIKIEGSDIAQKLNALGITAFVLKYRLPDDSIMVDKSIGPLQDAQKAILIVKTRAKEWGVDTTKVGIMGFSAGGHLASTAGTHFNKSFIENPLSISLRPGFMILVYPVISLSDSIGHKGSREALIGKHPDQKEIAYFSNELQVTPNTPPAFLIHAGDDKTVSVKNSVEFYLALQRNKVPAGMHIFPKGLHVFLLEPAKSTWFGYCAKWMQENGWIKQ